PANLPTRNPTTRGHPTTPEPCRPHSESDKIRLIHSPWGRCTLALRGHSDELAAGCGVVPPLTTGVCCRWSPERVTEGGFARTRRRELSWGFIREGAPPPAGSSSGRPDLNEASRPELRLRRCLRTARLQRLRNRRDMVNELLKSSPGS